MYDIATQADGTTRQTAATVPDQETIARHICRSGDYFTLLERLRESRLYEGERERIRREHGSRFNHVTFLSDREWEMLTILELYDPLTFRHALRVFESIHDKVGSRRPVGVFLRDHLFREDVSKEDLYRAALLHDIGKVTIPKEILHDVTTDDEWIMLAKAFLHQKNFESVSQTLTESPHLRAKDLVPFSCTISSDIATELRKEGIDPELPLGIIMGRHALLSGEILRAYGFRVSAEIAESHHHRPQTEGLEPISRSSFRASWILRAADIFDAVKHPRSYKSGNTLEKTLLVLEREAERGFIDHKLVALWVADELKSF